MSPRLLIGALSAIATVATVMAAVGIAHLRDDDPSGAAVVAEGATSPFRGGVMPKGVRAPGFELRDERGRSVSMEQFRGRPVLVTYLYSTCTDTCPITAQMIRGALDDLGHDIPALAISVDPFRDTAASARRFVERQRVSGRIRFVLGKRRELLPVWRGFHVQPQLPESEHQALITLVDQRGFQRMATPVSQTNPEDLAHDVRVLEREGA